MFAPSAIIVRIAGTPSAVAGIFTIRLRRWIVRQRSRAATTVPSVSWASAGATSTETNPSSPSLASYTGRNTSSAPRMSWVTIAQ